MEPFIGQIGYFGFNFSPIGWQPCDGRLLPISGNEALFSLIGTTYGGDGFNTFALPDLRGRRPIHQGQGPGLTDYVIGQRGGDEQRTLTANQMPAHTHATSVGISMPASASGGSSDSPIGTIPAASAGQENYASPASANGASAPLNVTRTVGIAGASLPFQILNPYLAINYCIATEGIYPSRA